MRSMQVYSLVLIFIFQIFSISAMSQNNDKWKAGSAKQFSGDIITLVCFISTPNNPWLETDKTDMLSKLTESDRWFSSQAKKFNVNIAPKYYVLNKSEDIQFEVIEPGMATGKESIDWVYRTMQKLGFKNSKQAYKKLRKKYKADNIQILLFAKAKGRPYSMRYAKGVNKKMYFLEGLLVFNEYNNGAPMPISAVIAHETLHIYGAWDLYSTYAQTIDRQQKARELYPNDIMLRVDHNINTIEINNLTAWLIGWNIYQEDIFEWFRPSDYKK